MAFWGPIIGAGISALGSLFGGGDEQETTTTVDYKAMARSAEKAGFNPLTAIRNGGAAGFTTTHHPALSMATRFGQAFQTLGNAIMSFDPRADERAVLENRLLEAQIGRLQGPTDGFRAMMFGDVPSAQASTVVAAGGKPLANPPIQGPPRPYGEPEPLYKTVWWWGDDGKRYEQHVVNPDLNLDDPTALAIPSIVRFGNEFDRTRAPEQRSGFERGARTSPLVAPGADPFREFTEWWNKPTTSNPKPQGNPPSAPIVGPSLGGDPFQQMWTPQGW